ncbi:golgin subfamily A member 2-like [Tupaia chinensis]|uniref:golgin subfamily A member 2-like n=1 Tax=Tupaia chinensis TaxID=246437 RepID=UPI0003C9198F|nr:golgin subfamily A member 2-like [Tupaia chinensis]
MEELQKLEEFELLLTLPPLVDCLRTLSALLLGGQLDEEAPRFKLGLVEELESPEAMLEEHKCSCQQLAPRAAPSQEEPQREPLSSGTKSDYKCGESHQGLQEAMEKLKSRFLQVMEEKAALQERVDTLEHCCLLLSEETETIGAYIALYQRQSAVLKERYREKDEFIHQLVQDNEKLKVELLELQGQVLWLVDKQKERQGKFRSTTQSPAEELVPGLPMSQEFSTADQLGACRDVSLTDNIQPGQGKAGMGCTTGNTTTQPITQLPQEIQNPQELADIDSKPCLPFFYRAGGNNQVKILVV